MTKRPLFLGALLVVALAGGCQPEAHKMGASGLAPGMFRVIPVSLDPSSGGLPGAVGDIAQGADGLHAWQRSGSNVTDWTPVPVGAATPSTAGLMSAAQAAQLANNVLSVYSSSALLDLTATGTFAMNIPQRPGFFFLPMLGRLVLHDSTGVATGPLVISAGNDASKVNIFSNSISASTINGITAGAPYPLTLTVPGAVTPALDSNTLIVGNIATAATGLTSAHGYVVVSGVWLAI